MNTRSRGAIALAATGVNQGAIAERLGCSVPLVHYWIKGEKKPGPKYRPLLREHYGIEEHLWDTLPSSPLAGRLRGGKAPELEAEPFPFEEAPGLAADDALAIGGTYAMARELEQLVRHQLDEVRAEFKLPKDARTMAPSEAAKLMRSIVPTLAHLAKMTGQYDLGRKLLQLPLWKRIEAEIALALAPFPEAARACAARLRELEAAERRDA